MKLLAAVLITSLSACSDKQEQLPKPVPAELKTISHVRYLALGDSYTVGQNVTIAESFPNQLSLSLKSSKVQVDELKIIARSGWTTRDLIEGIKERNFSDSYDFVTLLIGVNNQYRGESLKTYQEEFKQLLATAVEYAKGKKERVFVLSIPDWNATPVGKNENRMAESIDQFNAVNKEESIAAGISYIDITNISRTNSGTEYVADDGLHPSGKMYSLWVTELSPVIEMALRTDL